MDSILTLVVAIIGIGILWRVAKAVAKVVLFIVVILTLYFFFFGGEGFPSVESLFSTPVVAIQSV